MTDNEIIKALECCASSVRCSGDCPFKHRTSTLYCYREFLDLINRQKAEKETMQSYIDCLKAEIERLRAECGNQSTLWSQHYESIFETAKETIKAEAVKEFAERLKKCSQWLPLVAMPDPFVIVSDIDNLVKEMVGESR